MTSWIKNTSITYLDKKEIRGVAAQNNTKIIYALLRPMVVNVGASTYSTNAPNGLAPYIIEPSLTQPHQTSSHFNEPQSTWLLRY